MRRVISIHIALTLLLAGAAKFSIQFELFDSLLYSLVATQAALLGLWIGCVPKKTIKAGGMYLLGLCSLCVVLAWNNFVDYGSLVAWHSEPWILNSLCFIVIPSFGLAGCFGLMTALGVDLIRIDPTDPNVELDPVQFSISELFVLTLFAGIAAAMAPWAIEMSIGLEAHLSLAAWAVSIGTGACWVQLGRRPIDAKMITAVVLSCLIIGVTPLLFPNFIPMASGTWLVSITLQTLLMFYSLWPIRQQGYRLVLTKHLVHNKDSQTDASNEFDPIG